MAWIKLKLYKDDTQGWASLGTGKDIPKCSLIVLVVLVELAVASTHGGFPLLF